MQSRRVLETLYCCLRWCTVALWDSVIASGKEEVDGWRVGLLDRIRDLRVGSCRAWCVCMYVCMSVLWGPAVKEGRAS